MLEFITPEQVGVLAGVLLGLGYLTTSQFRLRLLGLLGIACAILYFFFLSDGPHWPTIWAIALLAAANVLGLIRLLLRHSARVIPVRYADLYETFSVLPPGDFRDVMALATRRTLDSQEKITTEGESLSKLYYVIAGAVDVQKRGDRFTLPPGIFVGEVAYLTGRASAATTRIGPEAEVLEWDVAALRARADQSSRFRFALQAMISRDLAEKVAHAVAPIGQGWRPDPTLLDPD